MAEELRFALNLSSCMPLEAKLQTHAEQLRQQRVHKDAQQIQLARLKASLDSSQSICIGGLGADSTATSL